MTEITSGEAVKTALRICKQDEQSNCTHLLLSAFLDQQHVGALDCSILGGQVCVHVLYVKPSYRELGIARALLAQLHAECPGLEVICEKGNEQGMRH
ncbi:GNAT family N-acetyltransferase [Undibacterium sp. Tian12W]|uniref:GNAT family N-acetyltransferase n=1 Tax=Undibacterium sp. Tian12W TaxID=3413054 RepID=UPI003BF221D4